MLMLNCKGKVFLILLYWMKLWANDSQENNDNFYHSKDLQKVLFQHNHIYYKTVWEALVDKIYKWKHSHRILNPSTYKWWYFVKIQLNK